MSDFQSQISHLTRSMLTLEKLWEFAGFSPNEDQEKAIRHVDGPLYLTAGPGSGKTRVLLWRAVNLIVFNEIKPEEIFLSTFTEKAAHQLKEGLRTLLGIVTNVNGQPYDLSSMYIGTVHSLCQRMLSDRRRFSIDRQRNRPPELLDELGQYFHLSRNRNWKTITEQAGLDGEDANLSINNIWKIPTPSKHLAVVNCIGIFNRFSEECIDPLEALKRLAADSSIRVQLDQHELGPEQVALLLRLYHGYHASLQISLNMRLTDYALLQQEAYHVLDQQPENAILFKHIIVDEYQDTNTIQEQIFFKLAKSTRNICIVGDDDQALYRFRGATVENFVEFPDRSLRNLEQKPTRISLDTNYRSRKRIVDFYSSFIKQIDWKKPSGKGAYRVIDKEIHAHRQDDSISVVASKADAPDLVCTEIASLVKRLIDEGKVQNPNQIAFLFPSMKYQGEMVAAVRRMKEALEAQGLRVYAPRAGRFLEVSESYDIFGLLIQVFGRTPAGEFRGRDFDNFQNWIKLAEAAGQELMEGDPLLKRYVKDRREELDTARLDYQALLKMVERNHWDLKGPYQRETMKRLLYNAPGLSERGKKLLGSSYLDQWVKKRAESGQPLSLLYIIKRATSVDWNLLDLFYRLCGFEYFKRMFDEAEQHGDEGAVANLGLITQYLSRFIDERIPLITADLLVDQVFHKVLYAYLFALYRLGETELEDADDPFPRGRIPFLTIHQSKGLEFPVVVLGNARKDNRGPNRIEEITRPLLEREPGEPLNRMSEFDIMRMFYVALSRAKNLLVVAHYKGKGQRINPPFQALLDDHFPRIQDLDLSTVPGASQTEDNLPKSYSFTSDFLLYKRCPRQYMIFRQFDFAPARTSTMFFGSLVHRTIEDLHHELIRRRSQA
jgi:DNA helicase II / ATP-dependent DNA helicase PcrA